MGDGPAGDWPYVERIAVRYPEVDMQRVVFNAHYLTYCDIAIAGWMLEAIGWTGPDDPIDWMLVKATVEWQGSATFGDVLEIGCGVSRWGRTSFEVALAGIVDGGPVFTAAITYVCVVPDTKDTVVVPDRMRQALGSAPVTSAEPR